MQNSIQQGAEAQVSLSEFQGQSCIIKTRLPKTYRHPLLDAKLTKSRLQTESKILKKAKSIGLPVPQVYKTQDQSIYMELIHGQMLKSLLRSSDLDLDQVHVYAQQIGSILSLLHSKNIIHGDLTTSNLMLKDETKEIVLIDFGLACISASVEDKAVDLYVLERAIESTHPQLSPWFFESILTHYTDSAVLKRLEKGTCIFVYFN